MRVLEPLAALPDAAWVQHRPLPAGHGAGARSASLLALAPRGVPGRVLRLAAMLPMVLLVPPRPPPGAFRLTVLDVGQGTAALVETQHAFAALRHRAAVERRPPTPAGG